MARPALHLGLALAAAASLLVAGPAEADVASERLAYEATGRGCPSEAEYRAEAERRLPERTERGRTLRVRLAPSRRGFEGTVEALEVEHGGPPAVVASRRLEGATCAEVAEATLLLVALGVLEAAPPPVPPPPAPPPPPPPPEAEPTAEAPAARPASLVLHAAAVGVAASGFGPPALGGGVRVGLGRGGAGVLRPELRAGLDVIADAELRDRIGTAERSVIAARADLCPVILGSRALSVRPCAAGQVGEVHVRGVAVPSPRDERRLHAAVGGLVRGQARIAGGLGAELSAGVLAPLLHHRFFFEPNVTLLRLDAPVAFVEAGLSWSIP